MRRLFSVLERLEGSLVTVLVEGESGVGKELVARALHDGSAVSAGAFVPLNCGAFAREVIGSELFGHRKGAFTGAVEDRGGAFEAADGGTLFLDEVAELPLDVQPMLLRALELGEIRAVGASTARRVRVRVVAATHRDLEEEVQAGRFRHDLFYRLAVVRLRVPPLRERSEDVELLSRRFATSVGMQELPGEVLAELERRPWAGNVRELFNAIQAYAALGELPAPPRAGASGEAASIVDVQRPFLEQRDAIVERFTRSYLEALLAHTKGNQRLAARMSGLNRGYLRRMLARFGMLGSSRDGE
jgi:DNA-binding NtrC family response regulator